MNEIVPPAIVREGFAIAVEQGNPIRLKLSGNADMDIVPLLGPYLGRFHDYLCGTNASTVTVDLRELYFLNSSCFKAIITWIASINTLNPSERYHVQFFINPGLAWQKRNLQSILDFAPTIVGVQDR
jgi:hypothetical protein